MAHLIADVTHAHLSRNYVLGVVNGALFGLTQALRSTDVVLSSFIGELTGSYPLVGLLSPIQYAGSFLPQLIVCGYLEQKQQKLPFYTIMSVFRGITWGLLALAVYLVSDRSALLSIFLTLFVIHHFLSGLSEVSFMDLVGKVIPAGRRGSFFGLRRFLGGILALGGSLFIRCILGRGNGEVQYQNFAVLFLASFLTMSMAMACFSLIVEPVESMPAKNPSFGGQLAPAFGLLRSDENFQRFLIARLSLIGSEVAAPFYVLYAQEGLDVSGAMMGIYLAVMTAATIVSNLIWGYLVDHGQTRLLLQSATVIGTLVPLGAMLIIGSTVCSLASVTHLAAWAFAIVFLLLGGFKTGCTLGHQNFLLSAAPPAHRPTYIALANSVVGGGLLLGSLGGLVVEIMGFEPLFLFAMVSCLVGLFFVLRLKEEGYPEQ